MCLGTRILSTFNFESVSPNTYLRVFPNTDFMDWCHPILRPQDLRRLLQDPNILGRQRGLCICNRSASWNILVQPYFTPDIRTVSASSQKNYIKFCSFSSLYSRDAINSLWKDGNCNMTVKFLCLFVPGDVFGDNSDLVYWPPSPADQIILRLCLRCAHEPGKESTLSVENHPLIFALQIWTQRWKVMNDWDLT